MGPMMATWTISTQGIYLVLSEYPGLIYSTLSKVYHRNNKQLTTYLDAHLSHGPESSCNTNRCDNINVYWSHHRSSHWYHVLTELHIFVYSIQYIHIYPHNWCIYFCFGSIRDVHFIKTTKGVLDFFNDCLDKYLSHIWTLAEPLFHVYTSHIYVRYRLHNKHMPQDTHQPSSHFRRII